MGTAKPGDPGQAGTFDPKKGGKFEPKTKAKPYGGAGQEGSPDHGSPGEGKKK